MPLLRNLKMRLFDNYVGTNLTSLVRNDYQYQFDLNEFGNTFPATNVAVASRYGYVHDLEDEDCLIGLARSSPNTLTTKTGHIHDFSVFANTECIVFDSSRGFSGYLKDTANDSLLVPYSSGVFSVSFWINPYSAPPGIYSILSKKIPSVGFHRFKFEYDSTGTYPVISFSAAATSGTSEATVESRIVPGRWSLVTATCSGSKLNLSVFGADGFTSTKEETHSEPLGCRLIGGDLFLGVSSDGTSTRLDSGSFYIQQVCFWDKKITEPEETELFYLGRGKTRFSDPAVPETFTGTGRYGETAYDFDDDPENRVDLDSSGLVTKFYGNEWPSPYAPSKTCDSQPFCYPNAMVDPSPDEISLSVSWTATATGCVPVGTSFTMTRLPRQIIQGFIFGRTFESEKITLPCGGYIRFFLESTPYHWSKYRYRQFLGVEVNGSSGNVLAKYNITMGAALVRNTVTGGSNKFTSPSPAGTSFDFPYTDSFDDYASDIVSSGWTGAASSVLYEQFLSDGCATSSADAACIVADGYIFGTGVDRPELRGGSCGWQEGISEYVTGSTVLGSQDSMYNYKIECGSPGVSNNTKVVPFDTLLNRPFSAIARGLIGIYEEGGKISDAELPFANFSAVLTPVEFVRPEPFSSFNSRSLRSNGPGGCVDCVVESTFYANFSPPIGADDIITTRLIDTYQCPQKTLSGATSSILSGSSGLNPPGSGLLAAIGSASFSSGASLVSLRATYRDVQGEADWLNHLGGTLRANGAAQFTSQIDDYSNDPDDRYLLVDTKSDGKINANTANTNASKIKKGTGVLPWVDGEIPTTEAEIKRTQPDKGTSSSSETRLTPVASTQEIIVSNCNPCPPSVFCESSATVDISGASFNIPMFSRLAVGSSGVGLPGSPCGSPGVVGCKIGNFANDSLYPSVTEIYFSGVDILGCEASKNLSNNFCLTPASSLGGSPLRAVSVLSEGSQDTASGSASKPSSGTPWWSLGSSGFLCSGTGAFGYAATVWGIYPGDFGPEYKYGIQCLGLGTGCCDEFGLGSFTCGDDDHLPCDVDDSSVYGISSGMSGVQTCAFDIKSATVSRTDSGKYRLSIIYQIFYAESDDVTQDYNLFWTIWNGSSPASTSNVFSRSFVTHHESLLIETRQANFESASYEDLCLRFSESEGEVELSFVDEEVVYRESNLNGTELASLAFREATQAARAGSGDTVRAGSDVPTPTPDANLWLPGRIHSSTPLVTDARFACITSPGIRGQTGLQNSGVFLHGGGLAVKVDVIPDTGAGFASVNTTVSTSGPSPIAYPPMGSVDFGNASPYGYFWFTSGTINSLMLSTTFGAPIPPLIHNAGEVLSPDGNTAEVWVSLQGPIFAATLTPILGGPMVVGTAQSATLNLGNKFKANYSVDNTIDYSPTVAKDPLLFTAPDLINWSGSTVTITNTYPKKHETHFGYSDSYSISAKMPSLIDQEIELTKNKSGEYYKEDIGGGYSAAMFPKTQTIDISNAGAGTSARYRLEGFPYSHWNRNGDNQMRLVSADWSIGKWPIYITVSPA